jgi:hypothetical protein
MNRTIVFGLLASSFACAALPGRLPLVFEPNSGQAPAPVKYVSESEGRKLWLTSQGATLRTAAGSLHIGFVGARNVSPGAEAALPGVTNVISGSDRRHWRSGVPHYARIRYPQLYEGIDLVFHSSDDRDIEYDFVVASHADASAIRVRFDGMQSARLTVEGHLVLDLGGGSAITQPAPKAYQDGRRVGVRYVQLSPDTFGFHLEDYNTAKPLLIDPVVEYAGFVSHDKRDSATWTAVDPSGYLYLAGTYAEPGVQYAQGISVSKISPDGSAVVFTTRIPANGLIGVTQAALDGAGGVFVIGYSQATNLPVTASGSGYSGDTDGYLLHLNSQGVLTYGAYVGGTGSDGLDAIFRVPSGELYVAGYSNSPQFRGMANPFAPQYAVLVMRANASGAIQSTRLLEPGFSAKGIAVDASSNVILAGATIRDGMRHDGLWPLRRPGPDTNVDAYIRRYDSNWNVTFAAYYGGSQTEDVAGVVLEPISGDLFLTGTTRSTDLPLERPWQSLFNAGNPFSQGDAYVTRISVSSKALVYATYLGGSGVDTPTGLAVDNQQHAYIVGSAGYDDFPVVGTSLTYSAGSAFLTKFNPTGQVSASMAVASNHGLVSVAVDTMQKVFVVGFSHDAGITSTMPGARPQEVDTAFFAKLNLGCELTISPRAVNVPQQGGEFTISIAASSPACPVRVKSRDWYVQVRESSATAVRVHVSPLNSTQLRGGRLDISGYMVDFNQVGSATGAPDAGIVDPITSVSAEQTITARYGSWTAQVNSAYILVNSDATGANGCVIEYQTAANQFKLLSKDASQWLGPATARTSAVLRNGICSLDVKNSFATRHLVGSMDSVAVTVRLHFDRSFAGPRKVFTMAATAGGIASGWIPSGSLTVPSVVSVPGVESLIPLASGSTENTFTSVFTHSGGATQHYLGYTLILPTPNVVFYTAKGSCLIEYNAISNGIRLVDDAGTGWLGPESGVEIKPGAQALSNAVCVVNVAGTVALIDGTRMTVSVPVTLKPGGAKGVLATFLQAFDVTGAYTGMTQFGTVFVSGAPPAGPRILNAGPVTGSGSTVKLGGVISAPDAAMIHARIGASITDPSACHVIYFPDSHTMNLVADSGMSLVSGANVAVGAPAVLSNSRCTLDVGAAAVVKSGAQFSLSIPLTFSPVTFGGPKYLLWNAFDIRGLTTHWVFGGSWDVK